MILAESIVFHLYYKNWNTMLWCCKLKEKTEKGVPHLHKKILLKFSFEPIKHWDSHFVFLCSDHLLSHIYFFHCTLSESLTEDMVFRYLMEIFTKLSYCPVIIERVKVGNILVVRYSDRLEKFITIKPVKRTWNFSSRYIFLIT